MHDTEPSRDIDAPPEEPDERPEADTTGDLRKDAFDDLTKDGYEKVSPKMIRKTLDALLSRKDARVRRGDQEARGDLFEEWH